MKNLFARLGIRPDATDTVICDALDALPEDESDVAEETAAILLDPARREQYDRVHLQYEAAAVLFGPHDDHDTDTHNWRRRLVEFEPG